MQMMRSGNVSRSAGTRAHSASGFDERVYHNRVLTLTQIVIRTPDDDPFGPGAVIARKGKLADEPFQIDECAIPPITLHRRYDISEYLLVVRHFSSPPSNTSAVPKPLRCLVTFNDSRLVVLHSSRRHRRCCIGTTRRRRVSDIFAYRHLG